MERLFGLSGSFLPSAKACRWLESPADFADYLRVKSSNGTSAQFTSGLMANNAPCSILETLRTKRGQIGNPRHMPESRDFRNLATPGCRGRVRFTSGISSDSGSKPAATIFVGALTSTTPKYRDTLMSLRICSFDR